MILPDCPVCHQRASIEGQQLYCANCGWNRDAAIAAIRHSIRMVPVGVVMFAGFVLFMILGWHFKNPAQIVILTVFPTFGLLINYFYAKRRLAKLQALPAGISQPAPATAARSFASSGARESRQSASLEADPPYQALFSTSRPRRIRMAKRGQLSIAIGSAVALAFASSFGIYVYGVWGRTLSFAKFGGKDWFIVGLTALILLMPYAMWRSQVRECNLLENGEIVMASIIRQWADKSSSIQYEFKDFLGQTHQGSGQDYTEKLFKDMTVPVFYDTNNPNRSIAYCSTLHEIVLQ